MTVRDCYNACLIELNKVQAPSLLLDDFVYLLNKNIQEYFNKKYNSFEKILQNTDDLRQLINLVTIDSSNGLKLHNDPNHVSYSTSYDCPLPEDYVHILGGKAIFKVTSNRRCNKGSKIEIVGLNKLDTNQSPQIGSNWYMRPSYNRPYYLIINIELGGGTLTPSTGGLTPNSMKTSGTRYGNSLSPIMLIICGDNNPKSNVTLEAVEILYLQAPRYVKITKADLDSVKDNSEVLEFSDYVCNEIIKQLVTSIMENSQNARIQSYVPVNTSIPQN